MKDFWIIFNYHRDVICAKISGTKAERWWNRSQLPDVNFSREYSYKDIRMLNSADIQRGVFMTAGMDAVNISNLRITNEQLTLDDIYGEKK